MSLSRNRSYRVIPYGTDSLGKAFVMDRHRHAAGYATVILAGSLEESSFAGCSVTQPGDVLLHGAFDCHANKSQTRAEIKIIRLPWHDNRLEGRFRLKDPDALARLSESDPEESERQLRQHLIPVPTHELHWTGRLAKALQSDTLIHLTTWAEMERLSPETVSRGFRRAFGVSPKLFRLESRARRAWNCIATSTASLTEIAHAHGFADLSHLSRSIVALTGAPPSYWRHRSRERSDPI